MIEPFVKHVIYNQTETVRRRALRCAHEQLLLAQRHICASGCGKLENSHSTLCRETCAVIAETEAVLVEWTE
jgi:hypothetical protein